MKKRMLLLVLALGAASVFFVRTGESRTKLVTLPPRERVEVQLDNTACTLVEEERIVTLLKGTNAIDFSWANTQIDKSTILFRPITMVDKVRVINVSYPPNENALVWEVFADEAGPCKVRISYLIANLPRSFNYRATVTRDESSLMLQKYIRVDNFSGEEYGNTGVWAGFGKYFRKEIGLNESKQMLIHKFETVPVKKTFTFDWYTCPTVPDEPESRYVRLHYTLTNDVKHNMGLFPLQYGKVRLFQDDGHGSPAFTGEDWGKFTPIDDEMKLYLGLARDISVKRRIARNDVHNINGNLYDREIVISYEIKNFKGEDAILDITEDLNRVRDELCGAKGMDVEWELGKETTFSDRITKEDVHTVVFHVPCPKNGVKVEHKFHFTVKRVW